METKKFDWSNNPYIFAITSLTFFLVIIIFFKSFPNIDEQKEDQTYPQAIYDILIEINPGSTENTFKCMGDIDHEYIGRFNYTFYFYDEFFNEYDNIGNNRVEIQTRLKYPELRYKSEDITDIIKYNEIFNKTYAYEIKCWTDPIPYSNNWTYTIYDNGKVETKPLGIYKRLEIICYDVGKIECESYYDYHQMNMGWIPGEIQKDIFNEIGDYIKGY